MITEEWYEDGKGSEEREKEYDWLRHKEEKSEDGINHEWQALIIIAIPLYWNYLPLHVLKVVFERNLYWL